MMLLRQTLLPEPVAPAMSRCSNLVRSATKGRPGMSLPRAIAKGEDIRWNSSDSRISRSTTLLVSLLGTSMPTTDLPGTGASTRTPDAARLKAMSSARPTMRLTLMPGGGCTS